MNNEGCCQKMRRDDKVVNRFVFTFISTSWMWVVYAIEQRCSFICDSVLITSIAMILAPFIVTAIWLLITGCFSADNISGCEDVEEAQNDFLANYLGYVFIGIGVEDCIVMIMVYIIIFALTFAVQSKCFNPVLLIFGYKYYNVTTFDGTKVFIITSQDIRSPDSVVFNNLRRINDMSYIAIGRDST